MVFNETKEAFLLFDTWPEISLQGKRASSDIYTLTQECFRIQATAAALLMHRGRNSTPTGRDLPIVLPMDAVSHFPLCPEFVRVCFFSSKITKVPVT